MADVRQWNRVEGSVVLRQAGMTLAQIAAMTGLSTTTVWRAVANQSRKNQRAVLDAVTMVAGNGAARKLRQAWKREELV